MTRAVDKGTIELLKAVDSPTICNAIELFKVRPQTQGFLHHSIHALFPDLPPMVGHAVTCTFRSSVMDDAPQAYDDIGRHVEAILAIPEPRVVVFQDLDGDPVGASFGEMLATTYAAFGCIGIVTSGGARDTGAVRQLGMPVFARSKNCSHGYPRYPEMNVPVEVGSVTIRPGDLLHGDADGVTTVPNDLARQIAEMARRFLDIEKRWSDYVKGDHPTPSGVSQILQDHQKLVKQALEDVKRAYT